MGGVDSNSNITSFTTDFYYISLIGPSVLIGFFLILSIFNQNLKGIAYLVGICVLFQISSFINGMLNITTTSNTSSGKCPTTHADYGTLVYAFSFFYLLMPMLTNGIVNMPILVSLILVTVIGATVNLREECTTPSSIAISLAVASLFGTLWSVIIYSIKPELAYHTDYISSNKLACSLPSKQKFKCVVKKNGEIIG